MSYFNRLTDIVTCNLAEMLDQESNPQSAIQRIIAEMEEGLGGAQRSVATAASNVDRLRREITDNENRVNYWTNAATKELEAGNEDAARTALIRRQEIEDVVAGLEQQLAAAEATQNHLSTTLRALEARLTEAKRKWEDIGPTPDPSEPAAPTPPRTTATTSPIDDERARRVDAELEALKRSLQERRND